MNRTSNQVRWLVVRDTAVPLAIESAFFLGPLIGFLAARPIVIRLMRRARYPVAVAVAAIAAGILASPASLLWGVCGWWQPRWGLGRLVV